MKDALLEWRTYRYFPYERDFASLEVERLFHVAPRTDGAGIRIPAEALSWERADRLTYFAKAVHPSGRTAIPRQTRLEGTAHNDARERQATRYSAHCLHEYRGRFNPQVVRALGNILGLATGAAVLDPFCGSGTTLLECAHAGWSAFGVDRNPLAVRIANAKIRALHRPSGVLQRLAARIAERLEVAASALSSFSEIRNATIERALGSSWTRELPAQDFLFSWFRRPVLAQVVAIQRTLRSQVASFADRAIFETILSDHLREASLQEPSDLRIRRRRDAQPNYPLIDIFVRSMQDRLARVDRARAALGAVSGRQSAVLGDIRAVDRGMLTAAPSGGFDAVITSPPYETALPYIDTQRLSLVLFGHVAPSDLQRTEKELIGAREIGVRERRVLEEAIRADDQGLPKSVIDLCRNLLDAAARPGNGFRRVNRPALAYRYFRSMAAFFHNVRRLLRPGAKLAVVVGANRTTLGGREFDIETSRLLADISECCGYSKLLELPMDTYPRYDLHQRNSISRETLVVLSAP